MTTTDRAARIAAIQERHAKATPGEWSFDGEPHNVIVWSDGENRVCFMTSNGPAEENAAFIVNARTDIPFLLTDNARLEAELTAAEARVKTLERALVNAAVPLEAMVMAGTDAMHGDITRTEIQSAVMTIRTTLAQEGETEEG